MTMDPTMEPIDQRDALVRARLQEKLTPIQYRRMVLLCGFDGGEPLSEQKAAVVEGVTKTAVRQSLESSRRRIANDAILLLLWLDMP